MVFDRAAIDTLKRRIGVTRVAQLAGLDRIGFPVTAAYRPASRNLSVSFGKGETPEQAIVTSIMESAELFFAETPPRAVVHGTFSELKHSGAIRLKLAEGATEAMHDSAKLSWVTAKSLNQTTSVLVPWEAISMDYSRENRAVERLVDFGPTGLAASFDWTSAALHGLYEVIERDNHTKWNFAADDTREASLRDLAHCHSAPVQTLFHAVCAANLHALAWDMTGPSGIPCYLVELIDPESDAHTRYTHGAAADLDADRALYRAFAEAIQVRLTYISGSRDDLDYSDYGARFSEIAENRMWVLKHVKASPHIPPRFDVALPPETRLEHACAITRDTTGDEVYFLELTTPDDLVHVVRTLVPGLEDLTGAAPPSQSAIDEVEFA